MTHEELDAIEEKLRKVDAFYRAGYGVTNALELVEEIRRLLPLALGSEDSVQIQSVAVGALR